MKESELVLAASGTTPYHVPVSYDTLADNVILVGDPKRVDLVKPLFDTIEYEACTREIHVMTALRKGTRFSIISTGMGCDNIDIVMNELEVAANFDLSTRSPRPGHRELRILRIGTCGSLQPELDCGTLVASHYAVGLDGLMNYYQTDPNLFETEMQQAFVQHMRLPSNYATPYAVECSTQMLDSIARNLSQGITATAPGFYGPQGRHIRLAPAVSDLNERLAAFRWKGVPVTNLEMETSAIFGFAKQFGHQALTVCLIIANRPTGKFINEYHELMLQSTELLMDRF